MPSRSPRRWTSLALAAGVVTALTPNGYLMHECWSGLLIALSLALYPGERQTGRPSWLAASLVAGLSDLRTILRHIVPNAMGPVLAQLSINIGWAILLTAGLSNALCATLLALLAAVAGLGCRRPAVRHSLWLLVLLKLIVPPVVPAPC